MGEYSSDGFIARVHNEREDVTREDILREADEMWAKCRAAAINIKDQSAVDELMTRMRREHKEFCTSYPIVMRYMVQFASYSHSALDRYLQSVEKRPWKNEDEYLDSQADYAVILYKTTHKRWNTTQVCNLHQNIRTVLEQESKTFKQSLDKYEKSITQREKRLRAEKERELAVYFGRQLPTELTPEGEIPASRIKFIED
jgi:hypothetical protein